MKNKIMVGLVLAMFAVEVFAVTYTQVNYESIRNSIINSTAIGTVTPSTAVFTTAQATGGFTGNLAGNAATATVAAALATTPTNCGVGGGSYGIMANGNALCNGGKLQYITFNLPSISGSGGANNIYGSGTETFSPAQPDTNYSVLCGVTNSTGATDFITIQSIVSANSFNYGLQQVQNNGGNTFSAVATCEIHHN